MEMEDFATLYGGATAPNIPVVARDYVSSQWDKTGIGGRPESFFDRLKVQQQQNAISAMPRNAEGFIMSPGARSTEGFLTGAPAPSPEIIAATGGRGGRQVATLQNPISPLIIDQGDEELVKSQIGRGGSDAEKILLENTYGEQKQPSNFWEKRLNPTGGFDYQGIKPVRAGDELLKNKAFIALQTRSPEQAAKVYHDLTGASLEKDLGEKLAQRTNMQRDYREGLRAGFIKGQMRRNPATGWLERKVSEPNPLGIGPAKEVWTPAEPELQQADIDYGQEALGVTRNPTILDHVNPEHRAMFFSEYQKHVAEGKGEREAAELAFQGVPGKNSAVNTVATMQKNPVTPSKAGPAPQAPVNPASLQNVRNIIQNGARNVHDEEYVKSIIESTDPVELRRLGFDDLAQLVITNRVRKQGQAMMGAVTDTYTNEVSRPFDRLYETARQTQRSMRSGLFNLPNKVSVMLGGPQLYPWQGDSPEEIAMREESMKRTQY
jgi:hypothetical protein